MAISETLDRILELEGELIELRQLLQETRTENEQLRAYKTGIDEWLSASIVVETEKYGAMCDALRAAGHDPEKFI